MASAIRKERKEVNILLYDLNLMSDDVEESHRKERKARKARIAKDQLMEAASDEIRDSAVQRMGKRNEDNERGEKRKQQVRHVFIFDEEDAKLQMLSRTISQRCNHELRHLNLDEKRLQLQREESAPKRDLAKREQELEAKRLKVQHGQLNLNQHKAMTDRSKGEAEIAKRKSLGLFLTSLAQKIRKRVNICDALPPRGSGKNEVAVYVEARNSEIAEKETSKLLFFWPPL